MTRHPRATSPLASAIVGTEFTLERLSGDGRSVGRLPDGRVAFSSGFVPGDVLVIERANEKKKHIDVTRARLVRGASDRITPRCPDAAVCGGCSLLELPKERARQLTLDATRETLVRLGGIPRNSAALPTELVTDAPLGYRSRLRLTVDGQRLGLFAKGSHAVVEVERCQVASSELWKDVEFVRQVLAGSGGVPDLFQIEVRHLPGAERGSAHLLLAAPPGARGRSTASNTPERARAPSSPLAHFARSLELRLAVHVAGSRDEAPSERLDVADDTFILSPIGGFTQVNAAMNRHLVQTVRDIAAGSGASTFLDLYSGSGNFSLPLARSGLSGLAVEAHPGAVLAAERAARAQSLLREAPLPARGSRGVHFLAEDAATRAAKLAAVGTTFDLVIVDAPRRGAGALTEHLPRLASRRLVLVSCDVATAARDLARLTASGLTLHRIVAFDMFPGTHHLELLSELAPGEAR